MLTHHEHHTSLKEIIIFEDFFYQVTGILDKSTTITKTEIGFVFD